MTTGPSKGRGQPSKYRDEYATQALAMCEKGATDADLAEFFGVTIRTISNWSHAHVDFFLALKNGKVAADDRVERSLYHKAIGYSFDTVKIFMPGGSKEPVYADYREHVPPDTTAAIFWLKNRRREEWRDKQDVEHSGAVKVERIERIIRDPDNRDS